MLHTPAPWHFDISVIYPKHSYSQIYYNTPILFIAVIFVTYCYTAVSCSAYKLIYVVRAAHHKGKNNSEKGLLFMYRPNVRVSGCFSKSSTLQWRYNEGDCVSNHRRIACLLHLLFQHSSKKTSKFHVTGLCDANSPVTGEFPTQRASNAKNVSIWWRRHVLSFCVHFTVYDFALNSLVYVLHMP